MHWMLMLLSRTPNPRPFVSRGLLLCIAFHLCLTFPLAAAEQLSDAKKLFNSGQYEQSRVACRAAIEAKQRDEGWWLLKIRAELATGQYADALKTYENAAAVYETSLPLRLLGYDVLRMNDKVNESEALLVSMRELAARSPWRYSDPANRVALGRALLLAGADARQVLELFLDRAKKEDPTAPEPYFA